MNETNTSNIGDSLITLTTAAALSKADKKDIEEQKYLNSTIILKFDYDTGATFTHKDSSAYFNIEECGGEGDCFFRCVLKSSLFDFSKLRKSHLDVKLSNMVTPAYTFAQSRLRNQVNYLRREFVNIVTSQTIGKLYFANKSNKNNVALSNDLQDPNMVALAEHIFNCNYTNENIGCTPPKTRSKDYPDLNYESSITIFGEGNAKWHACSSKFFSEYMKAQAKNKEHIDLALVLLFSYAYKTDIIIHAPPNKFFESPLSTFDEIKRISLSTNFKGLMMIDLREELSSHGSSINSENNRVVHVYYHSPDHPYQLGLGDGLEHYNYLQPVPTNDTNMIIGEDIYKSSSNIPIVPLPVPTNYSGLWNDYSLDNFIESKQDFTSLITNESINSKELYEVKFLKGSDVHMFDARIRFRAFVFAHCK